MSFLNQTQVTTLTVDNFYLQGKWFNTSGQLFSNSNLAYFPNQTLPLTTEVIINDNTKNQALYSGLLTLQDEIYGNIHGNTFPQLQAEIDAVEANVLLLQQQDVILQNQINATNSNVLILQGNVVSLQSQINVLSGNVVIDEELIAELQRDTQFLEAPYAGLVGNTSYFVNGLQMWSGADETGNGMFVYKDGGSAGLNQIRMRVEDDKNILIEGGITQQLKPKSTGNVSINNTDGNFKFLVGNVNTANYFLNSITEINGSTKLQGQDSNRIEVYTQPATLTPPQPAVKRVDIRGDNELRMYGAFVKINEDGGGFLQGSGGQMLLQGGSGGYFTVDKNPRIQTVGGSSPGTINIQVGACDLNTTGKINIGTEQDLTELGFKEIYIGQNGPPSAARKSSTLLDGDTYLPQNLVTSPNPGLWDNITYIGLPTAYSGPLRGPLKSTYTPYVKSISTFFQGPTINSFVSLAGTFNVLVGIGAITMAAGAGGVAITSGIGAIALTTAGGAIAMTTGGGAVQMTTGAGIINMTTGAGLIQMETNSGDVIIQPGFAPGGVGGSAYLKPRDYLILNPDNQVIFGQDGNLPVYGALIDTSNYQFNGNLFLSTPSGNTVQSNLFTTGASSTYLTGASFGYVSWVNPNLVANTYGNATMDLVNFDNNTVIVSSGVSPINPNTFGTFSFGSGEVLLPSNANIIAKIYPQGNIVNYNYKTWQSNALIPSTVGVIINAVVRPSNINTTHYVNVFGNVFFNEELDTYGNIVLKNIVNNDTTIITDDSIFTTGDITAQNFYGNSHQVSGNITGDYFLGNGMILSGTGQAQFLRATNSVILDPQGAPITNPANALSNSGGQLYFNGNVIAGGGVGGVSQIIAGNGIEISPLIGTGNVIVSLAGSVIPPGGYLPIAGGTMTGSIYQFPSSNLVASNTIKKYRPLTSYQPPFPSISTPSFTGEQLTFFNGDNSPEQLNFTGWFPENMFQFQPDVITGNIPGGQNTFYSFAGGTNQAISGGNFRTQINQFANGDHITGGSMTITSADADQTKLTLSIFSQDPGGAYNTLYQISIPSLPTGGGTYSIPIDYTYTGGQTGQNTIVFSFDPKEDGGYPNFTIVGTSLGGNLYNFQGQLNLAGVGQSSNYIGVQADATFSGFYEYFPTTNLLSKLGGVFKTSGIAKINGIYYDDVATSRTIIVYGDFNGLVASSGTTYTFNNIFMFNVDTGAYNALSTQTADPAYTGNLPKGLNGAVYGVEKQSSQTFSRQVWIWGDFTNVAQMGNPNPPNDVPLVNSGIGYTLSDNWAIAISWGSIANSTKLTGCRGGSIADDNPLSPQSFALMVWATTRGGSNFRTISIVYYDTGVQSSTAYPFGNGNFGNPALTTNVVNRIDKVAWRTGPSTVFNQLVFCGSYIGVAIGGGNVDVPCYSLSSVQTTDNGWNPQFNPPWGQPLTILGRSGDASFWYPNNILMGSTTYIVCTNGTINETAVIGTTGYSSLSTNGGGVLTMNNNDFFVSAPTVNKFLITGVSAYSVKNIIGIDPTALNLSCSLDEDNFWYGQTFNSTISPTPTPPTIPTVVAINGARFLVNNVEMDKIVFSGGDVDFSSVSFIAGSVEKGDPYWYWQSQVGALDYYAGNVLYSNITSSGSVGGGLNYIAGQNITITGNVISVSDPLTANLDLATVAITGNGFNNEINMTLDFTGLSVLNTVSNDNCKLDELQLVFTDFTNNRVSSYQAFTGIAFEDLGGNVVSNFRNEDLTINDTILDNLIQLTPSALLLQSNINQFTITKSGQDTTINQFSGNININTGDILSMTSQNAVEIGTGTRRQELVTLEVFNSGTLTGQNLFDAVSGVIQSGSFTVLTNNIYVNTINASSGFDDGNNNNSTITISLIQDDGGVETVLGGQNLTTGTGLSTYTITFSPAITINPSPTKFYFVRMSVPPASPQYSYYGTIGDGLTPAIIVIADTLVEVSDPIEYFNVYGNCFFQENVLIHATQTIADPTITTYNTVLGYSSIHLNGPTTSTSMGPGLLYVDSGVNRVNLQGSTVSVQRTDGNSTQSVLNNQTLTFYIPSIFQTGIFDSQQVYINKSSGPIASARLQYGSLELNHNTTGSSILLQKDAVSVALDIISTISSATRDSTNTLREFSRISTRAQSVGSGNQDGTLVISTLINGVLLETFNFNGGDNEINSFRPIDVNGQSLKTSSGNLLLSAVSSSGTGNFTIEPKSATGDLIFNGNNIQSATSGGNSGQHLRIKLNGVYYKIALQQDT